MLIHSGQKRFTVAGIKIESSDYSPFQELINGSRYPLNCENQSKMQGCNLTFDPLKNQAIKSFIRDDQAIKQTFCLSKNLDPG